MTDSDTGVGAVRVLLVMYQELHGEIIALEANLFYGLATLVAGTVLASLSFYLANPEAQERIRTFLRDRFGQLVTFNFF